MDSHMKSRQLNSINISINQDCCQIINNLLIYVNCISPPIESLFELSDGSTIAELIDNYEIAFGRTMKWTDNYSYIRKWLNIHEVLLPENRTIDELLKSDQLYCLVIICYSVLSIFIKNTKYLRKRFPKYSLVISDETLYSLITFIKWQLCEEEINAKRKVIENMTKLEKNLKMDNKRMRKSNIQLSDVAKSKKYFESHNNNNYNDSEKIGISKLLANLAANKVNQRNNNIHIITYTEI